MQWPHWIGLVIVILVTYYVARKFNPLSAVPVIGPILGA